MRTAPNPTKSPHHHPTLTSPAKPLISKDLDFHNEIKDLSGGVDPPANPLKTNTNIFSNKIKHLHGAVTVYANTLKSLENILYCKNNDLYCTVKPLYKLLIRLQYLKSGFFSRISNGYSTRLNLNDLYCTVDPQLESHPVTV